MVDLGLEFPLKRRPSEERELGSRRLGARRSRLRLGSPLGCRGFGEAKLPACLRGGTCTKNNVPQALKITTIVEMKLAAIGQQQTYLKHHISLVSTWICELN